MIKIISKKEYEKLLDEIKKIEINYNIERIEFNQEIQKLVLENMESKETIKKQKKQIMFLQEKNQELANLIKQLEKIEGCKWKK